MTKPSAEALNVTQVYLLALLAMIAFASNSLLCRVALKHTAIDPASFTFLRILSGAVALWLIAILRGPASGKGGNWWSALALVIYAAAFSFAYVSLSAATGALLLFGAVQVTMIVPGLLKGERFGPRQLAALVLALGGVVALLFPGLSSPPLGGSVLMLAAGTAWGIYSLRGRGERNPIGATTGNFLRAVPFAAATSLACLPWAQMDRAGALYAIVSGAITSGLGYVLWYSALTGLRASSAAIVQLSVPVLAATGGILLLGEPITSRYIVASVAVLGGIAIFLVRGQTSKNHPPNEQRPV